MLGARGVADSQSADAACGGIAGDFQWLRGLVKAHTLEKSRSEEVLGEAYWIAVEVSANLLLRFVRMLLGTCARVHYSHLRYSTFLAHNIDVLSRSPPQPCWTALALDELMIMRSLRSTASFSKPLLVPLPTTALVIGKSGASTLTVTPFLVAVILLGKLLMQVERQSTQRSSRWTEPCK